MADLIIIKNIFAKAGAEKTIEQLVFETAIKIHAEAVSLSAFDLGQLRNSWMWKVEGKEGGFNTAGDEPAPSNQKLQSIPKENEGYVGSASDHVLPLEFGTRFQPAQPALRPAIEAVHGASAEQLARKWGLAAMKKEFAKRKVVKKSV